MERKRAVSAWDLDSRATGRQGPLPSSSLPATAVAAIAVNTAGHRAYSCGQQPFNCESFCGCGLCVCGKGRGQGVCDYNKAVRYCNFSFSPDITAKREVKNISKPYP